MKHYLSLGISLFFFVLFEFLLIYFIMPFPGSQTRDMVWLSYPLYQSRWISRILVLLFILFFSYNTFRYSSIGKIQSLITWIIIGSCFYLVSSVLSADTMFKRIETLSFNRTDSSGANQGVMGLTINGKAKAYPLEIIGYHHFIQDSILGQTYLVTYCTVCHSGRVFSPYIEGKLLQFRLVGMDRFNAMLEDNETKSWWRQATGECIAGIYKGRVLKELSFYQGSEKEWFNKYPESLTLKPDPKYMADYQSLSGFFNGTIQGGLIGVDTNVGWNSKSWVIGVEVEGFSKAYLWKDVLLYGPFVDTLGHKQVEVYADSNSNTFYIHDYLTDSSYKVYQEFWHSWKAFHPNTQQKISYTRR